MLTIQSFLLKFRNLHLSKDMKKNVRYAMLIFAYAFIAVVLVLKFNVFRLNSDQKTIEAFAAQNITLTKEETPVLNQIGHLSLALESNSVLKQKPMTAEMQDSIRHLNIANGMMISTDSSFSGQVPILSADFYAGDLVMRSENKTDSTKKTSDISDEVQTMSVSKSEKKKNKSAAKEKVTEDAKETMNTGVAVLSLSSKEIEILQRIVEAEATGEDIKGKMLVANVIINRVNDSSFPDSVEEVVFQKAGGSYQFSPISDKRYYSVKVSDQTKKAVKRVLQGEDYSQGALYFSARKRASASNMRWFDTKLKWLFQYGNHEFFTHK